VVTKNLFFVSTGNATYAVDIATRKNVWSYPAGGSLALSSQGVLYIVQDRGTIAAISVK
jgi:outer membrane protein assembly factor BamB